MPLKRPPTPAAELMAEAARDLYGEWEREWIARLANDLGDINPRTVQAWLSGKMQLQGDHDVMRRLHALLLERRARTDEIARRVAAGFAGK
jgi:hypothetical protein